MREELDIEKNTERVFRQFTHNKQQVFRGLLQMRIKFPTIRLEGVRDKRQLDRMMQQRLAMHAAFVKRINALDAYFNEHQSNLGFIMEFIQQADTPETFAVIVDLYSKKILPYLRKIKEMTGMLNEIRHLDNNEEKLEKLTEIKKHLGRIPKLKETLYDDAARLIHTLRQETGYTIREATKKTGRVKRKAGQMVSHVKKTAGDAWTGLRRKTGEMMRSIQPARRTISKISEGVVDFAKDFFNEVAKDIEEGPARRAQIVERAKKRRAKNVAQDAVRQVKRRKIQEGKTLPDVFTV